MDQTKFLSRTLWQFFEASAFTDLVLVCKDGEVAVHSPILASTFIKFGFNLERSECLVMPDHRYLFCSHTLSPSLCFVLNLFLIHTFGNTERYPLVIVDNATFNA